MRFRHIRGVLLVGTLLILALASTEAQGRRFAVKEWKWAPGDDAARSSPNFDDSSWARISLPASIKPGKPGDIFWLRASFASPADVPTRLWFLTGKGGVALELYVDGEYAGSRGTLPPRFDLRATHCAALLIPVATVKGGRSINLALRCAYKGSKAPLPAYSIGDEAAQEFDLGAGNFWNGRLYAILSALCLFLGLYSLMQFLFKRSESEYLYFAITLFFCAYYLMDLGAEIWVFKAGWSRALARASLVISMTFLVAFFSRFFGFRQQKAIKYTSIAVSASITIAYLVNSGDDSALGLIFNISLLPVLVAIVLCASMSIRAVRDGKREAIPVIIAVAVGLVLAGYDSYYTIIGTDPFAWLEGLAFFGLDISVFIALAMRQAKLKADLESYSHEVESKKAELADSLNRLGEAGEAALRLSQRLEEAAASAEVAAEAAAKRSLRIGEDTERQAAEAREADSRVGDLVDSIERVHGSLASQTESAERTAAAATELSAGAESVARSIELTAAFTNGLASLTGSGEKAASALAGAMERVSSASVGIGEVVDAVNDFAERTNLLAMNAAIEAAHSGQAGRGFAIIAGEVKKLALSQAERAARIKDIVGEISSRVGEGAHDAENLRTTLREIAAGSSEAALRLEEVRHGTEEQKRASEEISSSMEALAAAIASIREQAERQADYSEKVRVSVTAIAAEAVEVKSSAHAIAEDGAALVGAVSGLRELTSKGGELTAALAGWGGGAR